MAMKYRKQALYDIIKEFTRIEKGLQALTTRDLKSLRGKIKNVKTAVSRCRTKTFS